MLRMKNQTTRSLIAERRLHDNSLQLASAHINGYLRAGFAIFSLHIAHTNANLAHR